MIDKLKYSHMGMFDYVKINKDKLPIDDECRKKLKYTTSFQTKDFDCLLETIEIMDDGRLKIDKPYGNLDLSSFDGEFTFYTYTEAHDWIQFFAYFEKGQLIKIEKVKEWPTTLKALSLTEEETKAAILEGKKKKFFHERNKDKWPKIDYELTAEAERLMEEDLKKFTATWKDLNEL